MSVGPDITRLLDQWLQLTQAEATAIESAAWISLQHIHSAKKDLQKSLDAARQRWSLDNPGAPTPPSFKAQAARLISLEGRNADLLAAQVRRARAEQKEVDHAQRTLRKIERSYATGPAATAWQCYS